MFVQYFSSNVYQGDTIACTVDGFDVTATVYRDDCPDRPDERDDGFWPSLSPDDAGYVGKLSGAKFKRMYAEAEDRMEAWRNDEWTFVGVAVTVARNGVSLTHQYNNALWGIESDAGAYLTEVANELLGEAMVEARAAISSLCAA